MPYISRVGGQRNNRNNQHDSEDDDDWHADNGDADTSEVGGAGVRRTIRLMRRTAMRSTTA